MKRLLFISFFSAVFFIVAAPTSAGNASLYLSPTSGSFFVGSTFDVSVFVNTGGENINAVEVNLKFDPTKVQIASPTAGKSFIEVWVAQPAFSNTKGTMSFIGGVPSPGINTSSGLVSTVTFRAISPGQTSIVFFDSSKVLRNDPQGTNILTSAGRGVYDLLIPPPEGPKVFSSTHPDQNKWYRNNNPTFSWEKIEGAVEFSYSFDQDSTGTPDNIAEGDHTSVSFSEIKDGIWYFHVKAKKAESWGGVSHYIVKVDNTPPAAFDPNIEPSSKTTERQPLVFFFTTDSLSGIDYYQVKYIDISPGKGGEEESGFFTEASSPYKLPSLQPGEYLIVIRAYDVAGNWREGTVKLQIFPRDFFFTTKGIYFKGTILPWWILIMILAVIVAILAIYLWRRHRALLKKEKHSFSGIEEKLRDHRQKY